MSEKEYNEDVELIFDERYEHILARCEECGELICEDNDNVYVDDEGNYFCSLECVLNYYSIRKVGD